MYRDLTIAMRNLRQRKLAAGFAEARHLSVGAADADGETADGNAGLLSGTDLDPGCVAGFADAVASNGVNIVDRYATENGGQVTADHVHMLTAGTWIDGLATGIEVARVRAQAARPAPPEGIPLADPRVALTDDVRARLVEAASVAYAEAEGIGGTATIRSMNRAVDAVLEELVRIGGR